MEGRGGGGGGTTWYADDKKISLLQKNVFCLFASHGLNMFHK